MGHEAGPEGAFEMIRARPGPMLQGIAVSIAGYREAGTPPPVQTEHASLLVPVVVSFGSPFHIALGREPVEADRQPSFAAGLFAGPVRIRSDGAAACVQVDLTPLGAFRLLGGQVGELAGRMVELGDCLGRDGARLPERLAETPSWQQRFALVEALLARRLHHAPAPAVQHAMARLEASGGAVRIGALAQEVGWSRTGFSELFARQVGAPPKTVARILRFRRACRLAARGGGWAGIAAESGFADQAHLVREWRSLAGCTPSAWARARALTDPRLLRDPGGP